MHLFGPSVLLCGHTMPALCLLLGALDELMKACNLDTAERALLENESGTSVAPAAQWIRSTHPYQNNEDTKHVIKVSAMPCLVHSDNTCAGGLAAVI